MGCPVAAEVLSPGGPESLLGKSRTGDSWEELVQKMVLIPQELRSFQSHSFGLRHIICQFRHPASLFGTDSS